MEITFPRKLFWPGRSNRTRMGRRVAWQIYDRNAADGKVLNRSTSVSLDQVGSANVEKIGDAHQVGARKCAELLHRVVAMHLHGDLADPDLGGDLLVHPSERDQGD